MLPKHSSVLIIYETETPLEVGANLVRTELKGTLPWTSVAHTVCIWVLIFYTVHIIFGC